MRRLMNELSELGTPKSKRRKQLAAGKYDAAYFAAQKAAVRGELQRTADEERQQVEQEIMSAINAGQLRVLDLVGGVDLGELAADYAQHGDIRRSAKRYGIAALTTLVNSLNSPDEKNRIVAGKTIAEMANLTDEERSAINALQSSKNNLDLDEADAAILRRFYESNSKKEGI